MKEFYNHDMKAVEQMKDVHTRAVQQSEAKERRLHMAEQIETATSNRRTVHAAAVELG